MIIQNLKKNDLPQKLQYYIVTKISPKNTLSKNGDKSKL